MPYTYLIINIAVLSVPLLRSFDTRVRFYQYYKALWKAILTVSILFVCWDIYFTKIGIWGFNPDYHIDFLIFNLPISEILFFITVPYACIFSYIVLEHFISKDFFTSFNSQYLSYTLATTLLALAVFNYEKTYTLWASISALLVLIFNLLRRADFMSKFYFSFLVLIIPFLIVNGILTGSFSENPIVWYNDLENLGIRLMNIPIEDLIYNFSLLLLNITLFEKYRV